MNKTGPALVLIDVQQGFDNPKWGARNNPDAESKMASLLGTWRRSRWPVFHIKHNSSGAASPLNPANPGNVIKPIVAPAAGEPVIAKDVNSAFIGTDLEERLRAAGVSRVVIAGLTTPHCVSTTARMSGNLGFETFVASDATAAFQWTAHDGRVVPPEDVHFHALAVLHGEFATVATSDEIVAAIDRTAAASG